MAKIKDLNDRFLRMESVFVDGGLHALGTDIKNYLVPDRGRFAHNSNPTDRNRFDNNDRKYIIDDTGEDALGFLVSGFMSMLTPPSSPWFRLHSSNPFHAKIKRVQVWWDDITQLILDVFAQSDFYGTLHNTYTEFCSFGTGAQILESDDVDTIRPVSFTFGEYYLGRDGNGKVDSFAHQCYMTAHEMATRFGEDALSRDALRDYRQKNQRSKPTQYKVRWLVVPSGTDGIGNPAGMAYNSIYWEADRSEMEDGVLEVKGFKTFPVQAPRWATISNDTYGKESPGQKQLGNIKMLQSIVEDYLIACKRVGDPPMVSDGDHNSINTLPGGITTVTNSTGGQVGVRPLFEGYRPDIAALINAADRTVEKIEKGFFMHLLLIISGADNDRKTAAEIYARSDEKYGFLGPILDRVFNELLKPAIGRTFELLADQGYFDADGEYPMPPELIGQDYSISFTSILAQAQEAVGLNAIDRWLERMAMLAQLDPNALDIIDVDATGEAYGRTVPNKLMRDMKERMMMRQARAQEQAMAQQMAVAESTSKTALNASKAKLGEGTVLDEMEAEV